MNSFWRNIWGVVSGLCLVGTALWLCGCDTPAASTRSDAPPSPAPSPVAGIDVIHVGDRVSIKLGDIPNPPEPIEQRVREDGTITLILDVKIKAAGLKTGELEQTIYTNYVPKYFNRLSVNVRSEERWFYVDGAVRKPDRYLYSGEMTALQAISVAGGMTEFAKDTAIEVTRAATGKRIILNQKKALKNQKLDIPIYPNDRVFVPKKIWL